MRTRRRPLYASGRRRTLALAVAVAASVVTPLAVSGAGQLAGSGDHIANTAGGGLPTGEVEVALAGAPSPTGVNTDIAAGASPVKEVTSEEPFSMVGVTWQGFNPEATATVRAQKPDGSWTEWFEAEAVDGKGQSTTGTGGTEPVFLGTDTTTVQIKVHGIDISDTSLADAPDAPADVQDAPADVQDAPAEDQDAPAEAAPAQDIANTLPTPVAPAPAPAPAPESAPTPAAEDTSATEDDAAADSSSDTPPVPTRYADIKPVAETSDLDTSDVTAVLLSPDDTPTPDPAQFEDVAADGTHQDIAAKQPSIISRAGWGADESIRCRQPTYDATLAAGVVHHTAGSNNYSRDGSAQIVRGIYTYHARSLGWCDVGYNVLVDKYGQAFEGRAGGLDRNVQGAHAGGFNGNTWGISMMGDYSNISPSDATIRKVGQILGWRLALAGVDPKGTDTHYSEGTRYTKYSYGTAVKLPNIFAHRDVGLTSCPGDAGYAKMGEIRDIAADYAKGGGSDSGDEADRGDTSPSTPPVTGGGGGSDSRDDDNDDNDGTGSSARSLIDADNVKEAVTTALKTVLSGDKLDTATLTRILLGGKTLSDIPLSSGSAKEANSGGSEFAELAEKLAGPLGKVLSGIQKYGDVSLVKHENGALYSSPATGTHPVWGVIGDAWAAQGFEHGPLGLPVSSEATREDGTVAQRFVGGTLVFDPATGELTVEPNP